MSPFARPPSEWTETDILKLIELEVQESLTLDYKESRALDQTDKMKTEMSKDISAFANSAGGTIIYGVVEENHLPKGLDHGVDRLTITKERLEDVITSWIHPRIEGVSINQIRLSSNGDQVIYVVDVPQAKHTAPHQAHDYKYYKRFNFKSQPMEDYEIRDVRRRAIGPDIHVNIVDLVPSTANNESFQFNVSIVNRSEEPALYAHFDLYIDEDLQLFNYPHEAQDPEAVEAMIDGFQHTLTWFACPWVTPDRSPLWKDLKQKLGRHPIGANIVNRATHYLVVISVSAPNMSQGDFVFRIKPYDTVPARRLEHRNDLKFRRSDAVAI